MAQRGWHADLCLLRPDETAGPDVERSLKAQTYDCVVIGAGIRLLSRNLPMLETVINAVHRAAPGATCVQHAPRGQRRCCRPLAKGGLNSGASIDARAARARPLIQTVPLPLRG